MHSNSKLWTLALALPPPRPTPYTCPLPPSAPYTCPLPPPTLHLTSFPPPLHTHPLDPTPAPSPHYTLHLYLQLIERGNKWAQLRGMTPHVLFHQANATLAIQVRDAGVAWARGGLCSIQANATLSIQVRDAGEAWASLGGLCSIQVWRGPGGPVQLGGPGGAVAV